MKTEFEIIEQEFTKLLDVASPIERISTGHKWTEGPLWLNQSLYFNDVHTKQMFQFREADAVREVIADTDFANGNTSDLQGNMISCEHGQRRVIRRLNSPKHNLTDAQSLVVLAESFEGKRLNSPNDVVVKSDGSIWFTDPPYGINSDAEGYRATSELGGCFVFRLDLDGRLEAVARDFAKPNGLAFSPDEKLLYIADSGAVQGASFPGIDYNLPHHIRVFDVDVNNNLQNGRVFKEIYPGVPDGLRVSDNGYIFATAFDGIHCLSPQGKTLGKIRLPAKTSNCCFGGKDKRELFITCSESVYRVKTHCRGAESLYREFL